MNLVKLDKTATIPTRATSGSAGYDLYACIKEPLTLYPKKIVIIGTGVALEIPFGYVGLVYARSGISTKFGVTLPNSVGVIDSDYRGELQVALTNISENPYIINTNDRIAQLVITPIITPDIIEIDSLSQTTRGNGGFGHSGYNSNL